MRFFLILFTLAIIIASCGEDAPYEPDAPPEITININPSRGIIDIGDTLRFGAVNSYGAALNAIWKVENVLGGNQIYGTIDSTSSSVLYTAPAAVPDRDSVSVTATLSDDVSIIDTAWVILVDPDRIYVDTTGSDSTGAGSKYSPYRTITYAVDVAESDQIIQVGPGIYDIAGGEIFPIVIGLGITLIGAGFDSTSVIGPGGAHDRPGAVFAIEQPAIQLKDFAIRTNDSNGIGVWVQGFMSATNIIGNKITSNYCGIYVSGPGNTRPTIDDNIIKHDSIGVLTTGACRPNIFGNLIDSCWIYGIQIADSSAPFLGDSTFAGGNTITNNFQYLIHNSSPDTIWAVGNEWGTAFPDDRIWDDDEDPNAGPVITQNP